ncbi:hypothetical protein [Roseomonas sp. 18066]|uniref:hypothetical protein n=1 Tax=Roseomonas sp. 18066 TaxID=2681412 RepID=UPI001357C164|nr:hypothetical protein [Roseomonas sp. 18066]
MRDAIPAELRQAMALARRIARPSTGLLHALHRADGGLDFAGLPEELVRQQDFQVLASLLARGPATGLVPAGAPRKVKLPASRAALSGPPAPSMEQAVQNRRPALVRHDEAPSPRGAPMPAAAGGGRGDVRDPERGAGVPMVARHGAAGDPAVERSSDRNHPAAVPTLRPLLQKAADGHPRLSARSQIADLAERRMASRRQRGPDDGPPRATPGFDAQRNGTSDATASEEIDAGAQARRQPEAMVDSRVARAALHSVKDAEASAAAVSSPSEDRRPSPGRVDRAMPADIAATFPTASPPAAPSRRLSLDDDADSLREAAWRHGVSLT